MKISDQWIENPWGKARSPDTKPAAEHRTVHARKLRSGWVKVKLTSKFVDHLGWPFDNGAHDTCIKLDVHPDEISALAVYLKDLP